jgi:hypothetical protein
MDFSLLVVWLSIISLNAILSDGRSPLMEFYKLRTGFPQKGCIWHYQGSLRNPANGKIIAGVEGIEFIQNSSNLNITEKQSSRAPTPSLTYLTKKLFFHVDGANHSQLLTTFRHSPISVAKSISPMKASIEFISLNQHEPSPRDNKNSSKYRSVIHFSPFRKIFSQKLEFIPGQSSLSSPGGIKLNHIVTPQNPIEANGKKNSWKKWISFGPGNSPLSRSTELYHIYPTTTSRPSSSFWSSFFGRFLGSSSVQVVLDYQRFGEGPEWFLPGRPVLTEMKGIRYTRLKDIPGPVVSLLKQANQSRMIRDCCGSLEEEFRNPSSDAFLQYSPWYSVLSTYWHKRKSKKGEKRGG